MTFVRWFGVLFGLVAVSIQPSYPDSATERLAWIIVGLLAAGSLAIWTTIDRAESPRDRSWLGVAGFILDAVVVMGLVWAFAYERPYVTWALLILIPMEGALRYRLKGALLSALFVAAFFVPQSFHRAALIGGDFDATTFVFVAGLSALVAGIAGVMAENWYEQNLAFEKQSLKLAEFDRLKDRFLAVTSHEIRGPLTAIITGVDTIWKRGERIADDQKNRILEMVSQQGHHLARLVDDLLVTSQLQNGVLTLQPAWAEVQATVTQAVEAAAPKRREHQLEMFVEPLRVEIDHSRIGQIVRNLVENAYKYTDDRSSVTVMVTATDDGIVFDITDDGPGIPPDKRRQLFEAFSRIEETAAGQEGVGLGLYVVSQLVAAMHGRIDLRSSSGGTSFSIFVPCKRTVAGQRPLEVVRAGPTQPRSASA